MQPLTEDDLDALSYESLHGGDPAAITTQLLQAVDEGALAGPELASYALVITAEIAQHQGDLEGALALARRGREAEVRSEGDPVAFSDTYVAELLLLTGREAEAMALLEPLRPLMATHRLAGMQIAEALEGGGRSETALEWLTPALEEAIRRGSGLDEQSQEAAVNASVIYDLVAQRHRLREERGLRHDEYDELFHELRDSLEAQDPPDVLLFWPREAFDGLRAAWPSVAEAWEPTWDEHRLAIETTLQHWWGRGVTDVVLLVGSPEAMAGYAKREGLSLGDPDDLDAAEEGYLDSLADDPEAVQQPWPPRRNEACWCGSGDKYKKCCLARARLETV